MSDVLAILLTHLFAGLAAIWIRLIVLGDRDWLTFINAASTCTACAYFLLRAGTA